MLNAIVHSFVEGFVDFVLEEDSVVVAAAEVVETFVGWTNVNLEMVDCLADDDQEVVFCRFDYLCHCNCHNLCDWDCVCCVHQLVRCVANFCCHDFGNFDCRTP